MAGECSGLVLLQGARICLDEVALRLSSGHHLTLTSICTDRHFIILIEDMNGMAVSSVAAVCHTDLSFRQASGRDSYFHLCTAKHVPAAHLLHQQVLQQGTLDCQSMPNRWRPGAHKGLRVKCITLSGNPAKTSYLTAVTLAQTAGPSGIVYCNAAEESKAAAAS